MNQNNKNSAPPTKDNKTNSLHNPNAGSSKERTPASSRTSRNQTPPPIKKPTVAPPSQRRYPNQAPYQGKKPTNQSSTQTCHTPPHTPPPPTPEHKPQFSLSRLIHNLLPHSIYNPNSQKLFGILTTEDLLLVALIFVFIENDEDEDSTLMILALLYILLSDKFDLSGWFL